MEEAAELGKYLPLSFKSPRGQEYIAFLWAAFETNNEHCKYRLGSREPEGRARQKERRSAE
jgi:hypothetical protein